MKNETSATLNNSQTSSSGNGSHAGDIEEYKKLSKGELIRRLIEVENEYKEFTVSSKELEEMLENELDEALSSKMKTEKILNELKIEMSITKNQKINALNKLDAILNIDKNKSDKYEQEEKLLKDRIVQLEISNDSLEVNNRVLKNKLSQKKEKIETITEYNLVIENELKINKKEKNGLKFKIKELNDEISILKNKNIALTKIAQLATNFKKSDLKISRFKTPPLSNNNSNTNNDDLSQIPTLDSNGLYVENELKGGLIKRFI
ncbi:unnamed protein product [[Candida] boidinii]|nr:unnamed protein product [[Candida] boidinii]